MEVATEGRWRFLGLRIVGAVLALLFLSMCTTFRPAGEGAPKAAAAAAPQSAKSSPSGPGVSGPVVSNLSTVAAPVGGGSAPPSAVDLPTPALPISEAIPQIPEPQASSSLLSPAAPNAAVLGAGEAIAGVTGAPDGVSKAGSSGRPPFALLPDIAAAIASSGGSTKGEGPSPASAQRAASAPPASRAPPSVAPTAAARAAPPAAAPGRPRTPPRAASPAVPAAPAVPPAEPASPPTAPAAPAAQSSAAASSGSVKAASPPAGVQEVTRKVYARVGDDITIALDGAGWVFTGGGSSGDIWKRGLSYETRTVDTNGTTFTFKATALGKWGLAFQQQDAATGATTNERVNVDVLTKQEFASTLAAHRAAGTAAADAAATGAGLAAADWLFKEGKYREALDAYEKAWKPGEPALTDKIAELAYQVGSYHIAREYWQKNFGLHGTSYGDLAVAGLMKTATAEKDAPELRALFDSVHALPRLPSSPNLLDAARYLVEAKQWEVALRYLEEYLRRYNGEPGADAADYLLGQIYEGDTPMQNARKALEYYREIVDHYPTSSYYDRARSHIVYLRRQFFEIR